MKEHIYLFFDVFFGEFFFHPHTGFQTGKSGGLPACHGTAGVFVFFGLVIFTRTGAGRKVAVSVVVCIESDVAWGACHIRSHGHEFMLFWYCRLVNVCNHFCMEVSEIAMCFKGTAWLPEWRFPCFRIPSAFTTGLLS